MKKSVKKFLGAARANKMRKAKGKPKGKPPAALRKQRAPRAVAPPPRDVGLLDAIGEVMSELETLGQEMRDWADNMPESRQGSDKHAEVEQCADTLEEQANADPVEAEGMAGLNDIKISIQDPTPTLRGNSRPARLAQALSVLSQVMATLEAHSWLVELKEVADKLHASLEEIEGELEGIEFPGMFG